VGDEIKPLRPLDIVEDRGDSRIGGVLRNGLNCGQARLGLVDNRHECAPRSRFPLSNHPGGSLIKSGFRFARADGSDVRFGSGADRMRLRSTSQPSSFIFVAIEEMLMNRLRSSVVAACFGG